MLVPTVNWLIVHGCENKAANRNESYMKDKKVEMAKKFM